MPKQVDHDKRRHQIADAVCRLAGRNGLDSVSLRHVAAEAGVSVGRVQHYFTTKDEMLLFAFHTLSERVEHRIGEAIAALPQQPPRRAMLRAMLVEMLPMGEHSRAEAPVWIAFLARAVVEPSVAVSLRAGGKALGQFIDEQIRAAQETGDVRAELDSTREATALLALTDGLMMHALIGHVHINTALATLDYHLDHIFAAEAPRH